MPRQRRLTWADRPNIQPGDHLTYRAGMGEWRCEAYVTVTSVGSTGVMVDVNQIVTKGEKSDVIEGENMVAGWTELEITVP